MSEPGTPANEGPSGPVWEWLEEQLEWYDRKSGHCQRLYKRVKLGQLVVGAAVPIVACLGLPSAVTGSLAAFVVVAEGAQQLYQWQTNWVLYRSTAESLKHEKYLYLAGAGSYDTDDRNRVLVERLEGLLSQEHSKWTEDRREDRRRSIAEVDRD